ncbi:MAG: DUF835 domain-containing protein [Methanomassiliicoccales archaeon]
MSEKDERFAQGYLEGYEEGLKEAIQEFIAITNRKNFTTAEIRLLAKNQVASIPEKADDCRLRLRRKYGVSLPIDGAAREDDLQLREGRSYLIHDDDPIKVFRIAADLEKQGCPVLAFTRRPMEDVREVLSAEAQVYWLSKSEGGMEQDTMPKEMIISPTDLTKIQTTYQRFTEVNKGKTPVLLFDVLGYLLTYSEFPTILRLLQIMRDHALSTKSVLLVSHDPLSLRDNQPRILQQEIR